LVARFWKKNQKMILFHVTSLFFSGEGGEWAKKSYVGLLPGKIPKVELSLPCGGLDEVN
jgi:hypothetical protein